MLCRCRRTGPLPDIPVEKHRNTQARLKSGDPNYRDHLACSTYYDRAAIRALGSDERQFTQSAVPLYMAGIRKRAQHILPRTAFYRRRDVVSWHKQKPMTDSRIDT